MFSVSREHYCAVNLSHFNRSITHLISILRRKSLFVTQSDNDIVEPVSQQNIFLGFFCVNVDNHNYTVVSCNVHFRPLIVFHSLSYQHNLKNHTQITSSCLQALVSISRATVSVCHLSSYCHFGKTTPTVYALLCNIFICKSVLDSHLEPFYLFVIMHRDSVDKKNQTSN